MTSSIPLVSRVSSSCFHGLVRIGGFTLAAWMMAGVGAHAQGGPGIRVGLALDPDLFVIGAHLESDPLVDRLRFRPNLEVGLGDDVTLIAVNAEFAYWFPSRRPWSLYAGGGPAINIYRFGDRGGRESDLEPGFNVMLGLAHRQGLFTEFKIGALDSPELRLTVGFAFD
jgi:hypothetical protein